MEIKIIIWIILGLIYLFSRGKKKTVPPVHRRESHSEPSDIPETTNRPVTFEELLREIQGKKEEPEPEPEPQHHPAPAASFDRPPARRNWEEESIPTERRQLEDSAYDYREKDNIYDVYENAKQQAFERPSLEETVKLTDTIVRFNQFTEYNTARKATFLQEYLKELKDPAGFKKAFIMSEIINRRF